MRYREKYTITCMPEVILTASRSNYPIISTAILLVEIPLCGGQSAVLTVFPRFLKIDRPAPSHVLNNIQSIHIPFPSPHILYACVQGDTIKLETVYVHKGLRIN